MGGSDSGGPTFIAAFAAGCNHIITAGVPN